MVHRSAENFNTTLFHQNAVEALNELISKTSETPNVAKKLLRVLDEYGVDCVNTKEDKGIVFWLRCRNANALIRLLEIHSSGELLRLLKDLLHSLTSFQQHWSVFLKVKLTVEKDNFTNEPGKLTLHHNYFSINEYIYIYIYIYINLVSDRCTTNIFI